jgi:hypothetical protein
MFPLKMVYSDRNMSGYWSVKCKNFNCHTGWNCVVLLILLVWRTRMKQIKFIYCILFFPFYFLFLLFHYSIKLFYISTGVFKNFRYSWRKFIQRCSLYTHNVTKLNRKNIVNIPAVYSLLNSCFSFPHLYDRFPLSEGSVFVRFYCTSSSSAQEPQLLAGINNHSQQSLSCWN